MVHCSYLNNLPKNQFEGERKTFMMATAQKKIGQNLTNIHRNTQWQRVWGRGEERGSPMTICQFLPNINESKESGNGRALMWADAIENPVRITMIL